MGRASYDRTSLGVWTARLLAAAAGLALVGAMVESTTARAEEKAARKLGLRS